MRKGFFPIDNINIYLICIPNSENGFRFLHSEIYTTKHLHSGTFVLKHVMTWHGLKQRFWSGCIFIVHRRTSPSRHGPDFHRPESQITIFFLFFYNIFIAYKGISCGGPAIYSIFPDNTLTIDSSDFHPRRSQKCLLGILHRPTARIFVLNKDTIHN